MKTFLLTLVTAALLFGLRAQTNSSAPATNPEPAALAAASGSTNAPATTNAPPRAPTKITSDTGFFQLKTQMAVYTGHVLVVDPQMTLTCELLTATVPVGSNRIDHIVAERNVIIDAVDSSGKLIHATGEKAVYNYKVENAVTNEIIILTGNPQVLSQSNSIVADLIIWDRINNTVNASNQHSVIQQAIRDPATNAPHALAPKERTNAPPLAPTGKN